LVQVPERLRPEAAVASAQLLTVWVGQDGGAQALLAGFPQDPQLQVYEQEPTVPPVHKPFRVVPESEAEREQLLMVCAVQVGGAQVLLILVHDCLTHAYWQLPTMPLVHVPLADVAWAVAVGRAQLSTIAAEQGL
jgi:hypothetical protein